MTIQALGTHSVAFDHTGCEHAEEHNANPDHTCSPTATWSCDAKPGDYCVFGCQDDPCAETGWTRSDDSPGQCSYGHELTAHTCWVLTWLESEDLRDSFAAPEDQGELFVYRDGPIDVVDWDEDYLLWDYA